MGERIELEMDRLFEEKVGSAGLSPQDLGAMKERGAEALHAVHGRAESDLGFLKLPYDDALAASIEAYAKKIKEEGRFENLVVLGIGGSALGTIMLQTALLHPFGHLLPQQERPGLRLFVPDNVDPWEFAGLLDVLDLKKTLFNVVTKSGSTAETMSAYLIMREKLEAAVGRESLKDHLVMTTDPAKGDLRRLVEEGGFTSFPVPPAVGGRFSVLSAVGLLPAALMGVNIRDLLAGARAMAERCRDENLDENPAFLISAAHYLLDTERDKDISVMMPYSERLRDCADWYRQMWAESLGKKSTRDGKEIFAGQTPVKALGATDQHSQIQLYVEGPNNKVITFLRLKDHERDVMIPALHQEYSSMGYLGGHRMGELLDAECVATRHALTEAHRPNMTINFPGVSAGTLGQFIYLYSMTTALAGEFYNINAFDQPGVEAGKKAAYALMGRPGYEEIKQRLQGVI